MSDGDSDFCKALTMGVRDKLHDRRTNRPRQQRNDDVRLELPYCRSYRGRVHAEAP